MGKIDKRLTKSVCKEMSVYNHHFLVFFTVIIIIIICTVRDTSFVHPTVEAPPWKIHGVHRVSPCSTECYFFIHRNPPRRTVEVGQTSIAELCLDHRVCEKLVTVYNLH